MLEWHPSHSSGMAFLFVSGSDMCDFSQVGGGVTIIDFPEKPSTTNGVIRCSNYSAHLGRWSIPVTRDDLDAVCGIDGCF